MSRTRRVVGLLSLLIVGLTSTASPVMSADGAGIQQATPPPPTPEGYVPRGTRPGKGLAPGMKVTDLGKSARTYRVSMAKGDEIMSGLTDFAEQYHIKNGHFTAL